MLQRTSLSWKTMKIGGRKVPALAPRREDAVAVYDDAADRRQPQDGARETQDASAWPEQRGAWKHSLGEPEDAWLTGGTRSLGRRLLGLNMAALQSMLVRPRTAEPVVDLPRKRNTRGVRAVARVA